MSPSYGLCLWQIPCWCEFSFSLVSLFEASQENEPSHSRSHYGKTKYGDKIAPCGRKKHMRRKGFIYVSKRMERASHFFRLQAIFCLYFVFLMSSGRQVWLFTGSPKGSRGNKRTWLPGMAASQTYKGRHKEVFWSRFYNLLIKFIAHLLSQ